MNGYIIVFHKGKTVESILLRSIAYVGSDTEKFISNINADIFFFSSRGITVDGIITDSSIEESADKEVMLKNSAKSYFL